MKILKRISFIFFYVLIVFMPLQTLLGDILLTHTSLSLEMVFWITRWYEPIILLLFVVIFIVKYDPKKKFTITQIVAMLLLAFGALSIYLTAPDISRGLQGFRFTLLGLIFYLLASEVGLNVVEISKLVKVYLITALVVALLAIIERFFPTSYWSVWHIIPQTTVFGYGWFWGGFWQSASIIGSPNQMASYLLPAVFLLVVGTRNYLTCHFDSSLLARAEKSSIEKKSSNQEISRQARDDIKKRHFSVKNLSTFYFLLSTIAIAAAIALAFSRAALVGLIFGLCIFIAMQKNKKLKIGTFSGLGIAIIFIIWSASSNVNLQQLITHGGQTGHQEALVITWQEIQNRFHEPAKLIFGSGLSTAGPLALKYGDGIISESWYLQALLELGVFGLILWLAFIYSLLKNLWQNYKECYSKPKNCHSRSSRESYALGLFLALIAASVTAMFLHTWADNPALTYTLFILIGINSLQEQNG